MVSLAPGWRFRSRRYRPNFRRRGTRGKRVAATICSRGLRSWNRSLAQTPAASPRLRRISHQMIWHAPLARTAKSMSRVSGQENSLRGRRRHEALFSRKLSLTVELMVLMTELNQQFVEIPAEGAR